MSVRESIDRFLHEMPQTREIHLRKRDYQIFLEETRQYYEDQYGCFVSDLDADSRGLVNVRYLGTAICLAIRDGGKYNEC